ncbi:MAG: hypothetical protein ACJ8DC_11995, partial [Gemmatimonadales bacterium]
MLAPVLASLVITLLALDGSAAWPQAAIQPAAASDTRDLLRRAHRAQRDFEQTRRDNLPAELGATPHRCDERIGRYCYWYDPFPDSPSPEPEIVQEAREHLLDELAGLSEQLPGNGWIIG